MMKNNKLYKTGGLYLALVAMLAVFLTSCLKDNGPGSIDYSKSPALVGWQYTGSSAKPLVTKILGKAGDTASVEITLSLPAIKSSTPVTLTVVRDPAYETAYLAADTNSDGSAKVHNRLPDADYTLADGGKVTINPGQQIVRLHITFAGDQFDLSDGNFILGLKLTNAQGAIIASNLSEVILKLTLKSIYEGTYSYKGFILRGTIGNNDPQLGGNFTGFSTSLGTISKYQVSFSPLWANDTSVGGIDDTYITVDPATNKVTMASSTNPALVNTSGYDNRYDPATKTFYISFNWSSVRATTDTLTYVGP